MAGRRLVVNSIVIFTVLLVAAGVTWWAVKFQMQKHKHKDKDHTFGVEAIGVSYGLLGNNLPPPEQVIPFLRSKKISKIRIYEPYHEVLKALGHSGISVIVGTTNEDLQQLSSNPQYAKDWVQENITPYASSVKIDYITAGNEVIPGPLASYVVGAMQNLDAALKELHLNVPVSTSVATTVIGKSYPPSIGEFKDTSIMAPIVKFLASNGYPFMINLYPYFAYVGDTASIGRDFALFLLDKPSFTDGNNAYYNLFDSMVDATYSCLEKVGGSSVKIVVSESGWPSAENGEVATIENTKTYNGNLVKHIKSNKGTPKRPGERLETYVFALFNENSKPEGVEQHFGLYYPNMTEVYHIEF